MSAEEAGFAPDPGADLGLFPELPPERSAGRRMHRYVVPVDDQAHEFTLTGDPVAVAIGEHGSEGWAVGWSVEFWAEHDDRAGRCDRAFRVFGTGHPLPADAVWVGTCPRTAGLVWHLYEVTP
jgi:hypothetical protein